MQCFVMVEESLRPQQCSARERFQLKLCGINYHVFDLLAPPSVGDVNQTVARLNDRGIGKTIRRAGFVFDHHRGEPFFAVLGDSEV